MSRTSDNRSPHEPHPPLRRQGRRSVLTIVFAVAMAAALGCNYDPQQSAYQRHMRGEGQHFDHETTPDNLDGEMRQLLQERGWELGPGELLHRTRSAAWRKGGKGRRHRLQGRILMVSYDRYRAHIYKQTETFDEYGQRILNQERQRELEWALAQRSDPGRAAELEREARLQAKKDTSIERVWGCQ